MDNGPEFIANITKQWNQAHEIDFVYIQPGKQTQNAYIERFNGSYRRGVLDAYVFESIDQLWEKNNERVEDFNHFTPHDGLQGLPPILYEQKHHIWSRPDDVLYKEKENLKENPLL